MRELLAVLGFLLVVFAAPLVQAPESATMSSDVVAALNQEEILSVTINFKEDVAQETVIDGLVASGGEVENTYQTVDAVSVTVTPEQILELAANPAIESIGYNLHVEAFLEQSVPRIRADLVHQKMSKGNNITGQGKSVCVLDTGVDYTHPDLGGCFGEGCKVIAGHDFVNDDNDPADDNGHGTHVAGIIAANGSLKGVAPGATIVAMKVLNNNGSGSFDDITAGIDWCVSNRSVYNISAISMSLGTRHPNIYSTYCDSDPNFAATAAAINAAIQNGISVVVATGNDGNYTAISAPGCIQNATRVAATNDADAYTSFSNRGSNFPDIILAPGYSINSTVPPASACTGNPVSASCSNALYNVLSGTSMATPHVSALVALVHQRYRDKHNSVPANSQVYEMINGSGISLLDSETGRNYRRIDALNSLTAVGLPPQNTGFYNNVSGTNQTSLTLNETDAVYFNASFDQTMTYAWKRNGTIISGENYSSLNLTTNYTDAGNWTVELNASNSNGSIVVTWDLTVENRNAPPMFVMLTDQVVEYDTLPLIVSLAANITDIDGDNITVSVNDTNVTVNGTSLTFNYSALVTNRSVLVTLNDSVHIANSVMNVTVVDTRAPQINFTSPANRTATNSTVNTLSVNVTVNETLLSFVYLYIDGSINQSKSSADAPNGTFSFSANISANGAHTYWTVANDTSNNTNRTETRTIIVDTEAPTLGISSPVFGSHTNAQTIYLAGSVSDLTNVSLAVNDTAKFSVNNGTNTTFNYSNSTLSEGTYSILLTATDSFGKMSTNATTFTVDRTVPPSNITNLDDAEVSTNYVNLTWTEVAVSDAYLYKIYKFRQSSAPTSLDGEDSDGDVMADNNGTAFRKMSSLSSNQTYWFVITTVDRAGNENRTIHASNKISVTTQAVTSEDDETQPASQTSTQQKATSTQATEETPIENPKQTFSVSSISPGAPYVFTISKETLDAMQIVLDVADRVTNVQLTVEKLSGRPGDVSAPTGDVYSYLQITAEGISGPQLNRATIRFRVQPNWLSEQNIGPEEVVLMRYAEGVWNKLETKLVDSNDKYYYYDAVTPGFSYFAISSATIERTAAKADTTNEINEAEYEAAQPGSSMPASTLILMAVSIGVVAFGIMWLRNDIGGAKSRVLYTRPTAFINIPF